jgi:phosphatidylserine decarboxylase
MWEATSNWCFLYNHLQFFRNPRRFTTNENQILAPVDGKVVVIEEVYEGEYYKDKRLQIYIHVTY